MPQNLVNAQDAFRLAYFVLLAGEREGLPALFLRRAQRLLVFAQSTLQTAYFPFEISFQDLCLRDKCALHTNAAWSALANHDLAGVRLAVQKCSALCKFPKLYADAWIVTALSLLTLRNHAGCVRLCKAAAAEFPDVRLAIIRARSELVLGNKRAAAATLRHVSEQLSLSPMYCSLAPIRNSPVLSEVEKSQLTAHFLAVRSLVAKGLADCEAFDDAAKFGSFLVELAPDHAQSHYALGYVEQSRENTEAATVLFQKATTIDPKHYDANVALGVQCLRSGQHSMARVHASLAVRRDPRRADAWGIMGKVLQDKKMFNSAARCYACAIKMNMGYPGIEWHDLILHGTDASSSDSIPNIDFVSITFQ